MPYCTIQDLRDEGVPETGVGAVSDARLTTLIQRSTKMIDRWTGQFFEPRELTLLLDGNGARELHLDIPIIEVTEVKLIYLNSFVSSNETLDLQNLKIYNRHLSGLTNPDDRENPRIGFEIYDRLFEEGIVDHELDIFSFARWPDGLQNVQIEGTFGYTDNDGTSTGETPELIRRACVLLVFRDLKLLSDSDSRFDVRNNWRVTELRTRDQTIKLADPSRLGISGFSAFSGDPEIDQILLQYKRPIAIGAV